MIKLTDDKKLNSAMRFCLTELSKGKFNCDVDFPDFRKVKCKIVGVNFTNIIWKPIEVVILEKGLQQEIETLEDVEGFGYDYEAPQVLVKKKIEFKQAFVDVRWISNYIEPIKKTYYD